MNLKILAKESPKHVFLACPTWRGLFGFTLVCSIMILLPAPISLDPYLSPFSKISLKISSEYLIQSGLKLMYPLTASTSFMSPISSDLILSTISDATSFGDLLSFFARSKAARDETSPYLGSLESSSLGSSTPADLKSLSASSISFLNAIPDFEEMPLDVKYYRV